MQTAIDMLTITMVASFLFAVTVGAGRALSPSRRFPGLDSVSTSTLLVTLGIFSAGGGLLLLILLGLTG